MLTRTLVPAKIGTWRKFPLAICSEGRAVTKLPGGPTAGCQSWPLTRSLVSVLETFSKVCKRMSTKRPSNTMRLLDKPQKARFAGIQ